MENNMVRDCFVVTDEDMRLVVDSIRHFVAFYGKTPSLLRVYMSHELVHCVSDEPVVFDNPVFEFRFRLVARQKFADGRICGIYKFLGSIVLEVEV